MLGGQWRGIGNVLREAAGQPPLRERAIRAKTEGTGTSSTEDASKSGAHLTRTHGRANRTTGPHADERAADTRSAAQARTRPEKRRGRRYRLPPRKARTVAFLLRYIFVMYLRWRRVAQLPDRDSGDAMARRHGTARGATGSPPNQVPARRARDPRSSDRRGLRETNRGAGGRGRRQVGGARHNHIQGSELATLNCRGCLQKSTHNVLALRTPAEG